MPPKTFAKTATRKRAASPTRKVKADVKPKPKRSPTVAATEKKPRQPRQPRKAATTTSAAAPRRKRQASPSRRPKMTAAERKLARDAKVLEKKNAVIERKREREAEKERKRRARAFAKEERKAELAFERELEKEERDAQREYEKEQQRLERIKALLATPCPPGKIRNLHTAKCVKDTDKSRAANEMPNPGHHLLNPKAKCPNGMLKNKHGRCVNDTNEFRRRNDLPPKDGGTWEEYDAQAALRKETALERKAKKAEKEKERVINWGSPYVSVSPHLVARSRSRSPGGTANCVSRSRLPIREHQKRVIDYLEHHRGICAAFSTGTGKTLTAVVTAVCLLNTGAVSHVMVVTGKSLIENFRKEMVAYGLDADDPRFHIFTYTGFSKMNPRDSDKALLIIDEAHEFRTRVTSGTKETSRSKFAIKSAMRAKKILLLTATPVFNKTTDIINLISMINGTPPDRASLPEDQDELEDYVRNKFTFFDIEPGIGEIPIVETEEVPITMTPGYYRDYADVQAGMNIDYKNPFPFLSGLRRACTGILPSLKADWVVNRIRETGLKTLVYSPFVDSGIRILQEELNQSGIEWAEVNGKMSATSRNDSVRDYNRGLVNVLIVTKAGGIGLDLKETREVILMDAGWNPSQDIQVIGRAARIGSHSNLPPEEKYVHVFKLSLTKPNPSYEDDPIPLTADEMIRKISVNKKGKFEILMEILRKVSLV